MRNPESGLAFSPLKTAVQQSIPKRTFPSPRRRPGPRASSGSAHRPASQPSPGWRGMAANPPTSSPPTTATASLKAAIPSGPAVPPFLPGLLLAVWRDDCATRSLSVSARSRGCRPRRIARGAAWGAGFWFQDSVTCVSYIQEPW